MAQTTAGEVVYGRDVRVGCGAVRGVYHGGNQVNKYRTIPHPSALPDALEHMASLCQIEKLGRMPGSIRFMMLENAADRIMRCCFRNRWTMLWYVFLQALRSERERAHGILYRFWRYKIQGKSLGADWHEMMSSLCPRCKERHEIEWGGGG